MTKSLNVSNNEDHVYHVAIMPCHDKKLEAERKDLAWERYIEQQEKLVADVDLVITTNELFSILTQSALEGKSNLENSAMETGNDEKEALKIVQEFFFDLPLAPVSAWEDIDDCNGAYISSLERNDVEISRIMKKGVDWTMKGSGSYAEFIFRFAALALFDHYIPINEPLPWKSMSRRGSAVSRTNRRNLSVKDQGHYSDHSEVTLYQHDDGTFSCKPLGDKADQDEGTVLKFATAYGFKNIQLLMQKIRNSQDSKYHYVETMACPSGCLNGGGQIKPETILNAGKKDSSSAVKRREKPSEKRDRVLRGKYFLSDFAPSEKGDKVGVHENQTHLLHTKYHVVPKLELATGSTAGVAVDDTHW
jgi:iron only hydrogenase large subunit-like protein